MGWLPIIRKQEVSRDPIATADELHDVFEAERTDLHWIALVIAGDEAIATQCLIDASGLAEHRGGVFRDWLLSWSRYVTARTVALRMRDVVAGSVARYLSKGCEHENHELLSDEQIACLRQIDPWQVVDALDPLARAVLVLRGILKASIADCALLLQVPRKCVISSYCDALRWVSERTPVVHTPAPVFAQLWGGRYAEEG